MKLVPATNRTPDRSISGLGTVETLILAAVACYAIVWAYDSIYASFFEVPSTKESVAIAAKVVSVAEAATEAGLNFVVAGDVNETLERVATGTTAQSGQFAGQFFGMPQLDAEAKQAAAAHLSFDRGQLTLNQSASDSWSIQLGDG